MCYTLLDRGNNLLVFLTFCHRYTFLQVRQRGVVRKPAHVHNYVHNAQMVVDALAGPILNMDLSHITGEAIVRGDTVAIR